MSDEAEQSPTNYDALAVFPLSGTVFFPGTVLPLHIFEPRYREMVKDALAGDRSIAVVLAKGSTEPGETPPVHEVAGCGRIIHAERIADGRYNILLQGTERVRLVEELPRELSYRRFRSEIIPRPTPEALVAARHELAKLQSCVLSLQSIADERDGSLVEVLRSTSDPIELADILSASVVSNPVVQQQLLAEAVLRDRLAVLIDAPAEVMLRFNDCDAPALN